MFPLSRYLSGQHILFTVIWPVGHMVKDRSDNERGNPLPPLHGLLFLIQTGMYIIPDRITHTMAYVTPIVEHWFERDIAQ